MSSLSPRATKSTPGWQPQPGLKNSNQHLTTHNTTQPPSAGTKALQNYTVTSYPVGDNEGHTDIYSRQSFEEHSSQNGHVQPDGRTSSSTLDTTSQHLSSTYLTPDYGSEIPYSEQSNFTSPSIDDFIWHEGFSTTQNYDDFGNNDTLVNSIFADINHNNDLQGIVPKDITPTTLEPRSLTPRMSSTNTVTAATDYAPKILAVGQPVPDTDQRVTGAMTTDNNKRARVSDDEEEMQVNQFLNPSSLERPSSSAGHTSRTMMRPTVTVSTYNRGDSPARTTLPMARSLSKRSQSSRLSDHGQSIVDDEDIAEESQPLTSRLMPPSHYDNSAWTGDDGDEDEENRSGVVPTQRTADEIPSLKDMDKQRELDDTRVGVENWLATSNPGSPIASDFGNNPLRGGIRRSRSTGARTKPLGGLQFSDKHILGPGVLLDVDSASDYSEDDSSNILTDEGTETMPESPPAQIQSFDPAYGMDETNLPDEDSIAPEDQEPLPRQFYRRAAFEDAAKYPGPVETQGQPPTANQAMMQYDQLISRFETASRAATWGTRRRLSDSEIASIIDGTKVRHLSISSKARDRGNSIINRARTAIRRSSSNIKKNKDHPPKQTTPPNEPAKMTLFENDQDHTVTSPIQQIQRQFSWGKSKSPPLQTKNTSTGGAILAMTSQLTAVGSRTPGGSIEPLERPGPKSPFLNALKRSRSKSDLPKTSKTTGGLSDLFNKYGGPPVTTLGSSPMPTQDEISVPNHASNAATSGDDDMDEDNEHQVPQKMALPVQHHNIIPNLDGFRTHAKQLNPRLQQYLVERIAQDQLRRYKKLVKNKVDHTRFVQNKQACPSREFCVDLGGKPKILPPRTSAKDSNVNYAQFKVHAGGDSDGDEAAFVEGIVTPALFPPGIPLPPTTHLPAEFECPLCFQVKKFQKPSDWTKHVHEDVQPFSCTFPNCPEPKSFKRKADWVRHENERHRHLEWWRCNIQECNHVCYRKDNFVQHLVREHKMTEPKAKGQKPTGNRTRPAGRSGLGQEANDFWNMVDQCQHETHDLPKDEPCKFCGNICSSWKKLSVHVGKHMEQIAMPVLELAAKRAITADTIISPIDPPNPRMIHTNMLETNGLNGNSMDALSPYSASAVSGYQASSASHSPVPVHSVHGQSNNSGQMFYDPSMIQNGVQAMNSNNLQQFNSNAVNHNFAIPSYQMGNGQNYLDMAHQTNAYTQQPVTQSIPATFHAHQVPRSQPMDTAYGGLNVNTMQAPMYGHDQYYPHSAPGTDFIGGFGNGMNHNEGLHSPHHGQAGHLHSPAAGVRHNGNEYVFPQQNGGHTGSYY